MEPFSYASAAYVVASALVSVRLFCKNLGNLKKFFGQMVYRPPLAKNNPYAYDRTKCRNSYNVFCKQFDRNAHFSPSEFSSAVIKIGV